MGDPGGILRGVGAIDWGGVELRARSIVTALSRHDAATGLHAERVGQIAGAIAEELGGSADDIARARIAGMVHDAGKLDTPLSILAKPAQLTEAERGVIQLHPLRTLDVAASYGIPDDVARAGALHHEMPSGRGYPYGLQGDAIPELTGIVSTADVFEALTGARPYRTPATATEALDDLAARVERGELFGDPVAALERLVRRGSLPA
jgi:HD-GYP domain-containing protein (c-di-GMP phosphodiesterase class II)